MTRLGWTCPECSTPYVEPDLVCATCGTVAGQLRWVLSNVERMCMYRRYFDLPPIGPHRPVADALWASFGTQCSACGGTGGVPPGLVMEWQRCRACAGHGRLPAPDSPEMQELREVVREFMASQETPARSSGGGGLDE